MHQYSTIRPYGNMNTMESFLTCDFGIQSTSQAATSHLIQSLQDKYEIPVDPSGTKFLGFVLDWDYPSRKVYLCSTSTPEFLAYTSSTCTALTQQTSIWPKYSIF